MKLVDALIESLIEWDVKYVFGVSGANIEHVHDAINRLGNKRLQSVMSKCEDGAAFMADCRARVHRTLGVCCSTSGGGMVNLLAGVAEAYAESVPLLVLVGQPPSNLEGKGAFQDSSGLGRSVDGIKLWSAVSKFTKKITDHQEFWSSLREAVATALTGRPGPSVLLVPRDMYDKDVEAKPADWPETLADFVKPVPVAHKSVEPIFNALVAAKSPVIVLGHGSRRSHSQQSIIDFAEQARIPVISTMSARAEFPNDSQLYYGMVGVAGHPSAHAYLKDQADLILVVGAGLNIMTRAPLLGFIGSKRVAAINIDLGEISQIVSSDLMVAADAGMAFRALLELWEGQPFKKDLPGDYEIKEFEAVLAPPIPPSHEQPMPERPLLQSEAIALLAKSLPEYGHLVFDAGNCAAAALHMTRVPKGTTSTIALGMGGMGYAIAGAIGAQLGSAPGTRTVVFCGDGAFLMVGFEIHTAVDLRLPILFVVFNNNMHGMCVTRQQLFFESRLECVQYSYLNAAQSARGLGTPDRLWVGSAATLAELETQLKDYSQHLDIPGVLELCLTREEVPPFTPFLPSDAKTRSGAPG